MQLGKLWLFILSLLTNYVVSAQSIPVLERKVSIPNTSKPIVDIFLKITEQTKVEFSYNPKDFNDQKIVTVHYIKKPIRLILDELIKNSNCKYSIKKNYVIITKSKQVSQSQQQTITLNGYIYSLPDSAAISNASIYIKSNKQSTISNPYGYFTLNSKNAGQELSISAAKENFKDTTLIIKYSTNNKINIYLVPNTASNNSNRITSEDTIHKIDLLKIKQVNNSEIGLDSFGLRNYFFNYKNLFSNYKNIKETFTAKLSFSLVPYLSTNKFLSINTKNKISINALVGYSKGVSLLEIGGLQNIVNGSVSGAQFAGIGNVVIDSMIGAQFGGVFNLNGKYSSGYQAAGVFNITPIMQGVQTAGVFNHTNMMRGAQFSGVYNYNKVRLKGIQAAGVFNYSKSIHGTQLAGVINIAQTVQGSQVSGLINQARIVHGTQISVFNFSDSCYGVPIGFLSYVKNGYHKIELNVNEMSFINLGFRTGVQKLHNIFTIGKALNNSQWYTFGYGLGTSFKLSKNIYLTTNITANQFLKSNFDFTNLSMNDRIETLIDFSLGKMLQIGLGPAINFLMSSASAKEPYIPNQEFVIFSNKGSQLNSKIWVGGTMSIKLL